MTRKDYQLIAEAIKISVRYEQSLTDTDGVGLDAVKNVAYDLVKALAADNPRFDKERFLVAAGVYEKCDYCENRASSFSSSLQWCAAHRGEGLLDHYVISKLA